MRNRKSVPVSRIIILLIVLINAIVIEQAYVANENWYFVLIVTLPLLVLAITNIRQRKHAILKNFSVFGYLRHFFESLRPKIRDKRNDGGKSNSLTITLKHHAKSK